MLAPDAYDRIADQSAWNGLLPPRPPADLPRDPRTGGEEQALRRGDARRMVRVAGPGRTGRRRRVPDRTGQHHAVGRQHHGLRGDRARQGGAAAADRRRHRASSTTASSPKAATAAKSSPRPNRRCSRIAEAGARGRTDFVAGAPGADRKPSTSCRSATRAGGSDHRPADRLHRIRRDDRRPAADRPDHPRRAPGDGQDHARAEHGRVRRAQDARRPSRSSRWKCRPRSSRCA